MQGYYSSPEEEEEDDSEEADTETWNEKKKLWPQKEGRVDPREVREMKF